MERELYEVMDWAAVEEIVYSESVDPHAILGPHKTDKEIGRASCRERVCLYV